MSKKSQKPRRVFSQHSSGVSLSFAGFTPGADADSSTGPTSGTADDVDYEVVDDDK